MPAMRYMAVNKIHGPFAMKVDMAMNIAPIG